MTVDLSKFKQGDWLRLADGALIRPMTMTMMDRGPYRYYLCDGHIPYNRNGLYCSLWGTKETPHCKANIVEIIPAERMTLLEWVTDRVPTEADALNKYVQVLDNAGVVLGVGAKHVDLGRPWAHCPGWTPPTPKPYVKMPPAELIQEWRTNWRLTSGSAPDWSAYLVRCTAEWCAQQREQQL